MRILSFELFSMISISFSVWNNFFKEIDWSISSGSTLAPISLNLDAIRIAFIESPPWDRKSFSKSKSLLFNSLFKILIKLLLPLEFSIDWEFGNNSYKLLHPKILSESIIIDFSANFEEILIALIESPPCSKKLSEKLTFLFNTLSITDFISSDLSNFLKIAFLNSHLIVKILSVSKISIVISNGDFFDFIGICFKKPSSSVFTLLNAKNTSNKGFLV